MASRNIRVTITGAQEDYPRLLAASLSRLPTTYGGGGAFALAVSEAGIAASIAPKKRRGASKAEPVLLLTSDSKAFEPSTLKAAKAAIRQIKAGAPKKAGPLSLRGTWTGTITLKDSVGTKTGLHDSLRITLKRKISTYGWLRLSWARAGWSWTFERLATWGGERAFTSGKRLDYSLNEAVKLGIAEAMGLVGEVCQVKATHRRAALDPVYGEKRPIKRRKPARDVLARFLQQQEDKRTPKTPRTQRQLDKAAQAVVDGAEELLEDLGRRIPKGAGRRSTAERALQRASLEAYGIYEDYIAAEHVSVGDVHMSVRELVVELTAAVGPDNDKGHKAIKALAAHLRAQPAALDRHAALLRFAYAALSSSKCSGTAEQEARALLQEAVAAYEDAVKAHGEGKTRREFRKIRDSLKAMVSSAAKTSRSCTIGQQALALGAKGTKSEKAAAKPTRRAPKGTDKVVVCKTCGKGYWPGEEGPHIAVGSLACPNSGWERVRLQELSAALKARVRDDLAGPCGAECPVDGKAWTARGGKGSPTESFTCSRTKGHTGMHQATLPPVGRQRKARKYSWSDGDTDVTSEEALRARSQEEFERKRTIPTDTSQPVFRALFEGGRLLVRRLNSRRYKGVVHHNDRRTSKEGSKRELASWAEREVNKLAAAGLEVDLDLNDLGVAAPESAADKANLDRLSKLEDALHLARSTQHTPAHRQARAALQRAVKAHGTPQKGGKDKTTVTVLKRVTREAQAFLKPAPPKKKKASKKAAPSSTAEKDALLMASFKEALADVLGGM